MLQKVLCILCASALVSAGVIGTDYSPATLVSYSSVPTPVVTKAISTPIVEKTTEPVGYKNIIKSSPIYESVLTTQESNFKTPDVSQHTAYSKSLDTSYSSIKKYESRDTKDDSVTANSIPAIYSTGENSPIIYHHPETAYTVSAPITSYTPVVAKTKVVSSGLSSVSSHTPVIEAQPFKTTFTYSEAPIVSRMTFSGLGTSYSW